MAEVVNTARDVPDHVRESIDTVAELRAKMDREVETHQLGIESFTKRLGRPAVVYGSLSFVVLWIVANAVIEAAGDRTLDPFPFPLLQGIVSLAAFMMTILILTTTTRLGEVADRRARLALQMEILTEQKVAKAIEMLDLLRRDDPQLQKRVDPVAAAMAAPADSHSIADALDESHRTLLGE